MAPNKGSRSKSSKSGLTPSSKTKSTLRESDSFALGPSKRDKRAIKHSTFVSKIEKTNTKSPRKRRPSKKLVANLESLADSLPAPEASGDAGMVTGQAKIKQKSMKSRPGAMKKKERLERAEKDRFGKNMAQMTDNKDKRTLLAGDTTLQRDQGSTQSRWAALRGFISQTMERGSQFLSMSSA